MKFLFTYEDIKNAELIRVYTRFGKQLAFIDLTTKTLYNTACDYTLFYQVAKEFSFMLTGAQFLPRYAGIGVLK